MSLVTGVLVSGSAYARPPWQPREPPVEPPASHQLRSLATWPAEPEAPADVDAGRFRTSLAHLCQRPPEAVPSDELLAAAREANVDPFLLAALMYEQSHCDPKKKSRAGFGLLGLHPRLYKSPGAPAAPVERRVWSTRRLYNAAQNLSTGARLLRMWEDTHAEIDEAFESMPHRSAVSHFIWGDRVRSSGAEDLILTTRRRLFQHYASTTETPRSTTIGIDVLPPLEGSPRVATSGPGDDREGGERRHRGLDIVASEGEPVRAIADGYILFAGANLPTNARRGPIPPEKIARYARRRLGSGGIYLCIQHTDNPTPEKKGIVSCYMHLSSYKVRADERVTAGQTIGWVGKTGVQVSPAHLHLEVRVDDRAQNPLRCYAGDLVIPPKATLTYRYVRAAKRARLRAERLSTHTGG